MDLPTRLAELHQQSMSTHQSLVTVHYVLVTSSLWKQLRLQSALRQARSFGVLIQHEVRRAGVGVRTHQIILTGQALQVLAAVRTSMRHARESTCIS